MTSPRDIRRFSEKWLEVFDWFEAHPDETYVVECGDKARAHTLRFEFYRAREAMRRESELRAMYANTDRREVSIVGSRVLFKFKERTPLADLLENSLKQQQHDKRKGDRHGRD